MKIKKYEVSDMKEAMHMIKDDLGPDAVILDARKVMKNNNFGLFARPVLEVTAAVEYDGVPLDEPNQSYQSGYGYKNYLSAYTKTAKKQIKRSTSSENYPATAQPVKKQIIENDDVSPTHMPKQEDEEYIKSASKKQAKHHRYEEDNEQDITKQQVQTKSQAELSAERIVAVIKAVGLDKFTDLLEDVGEIKKQLATVKNHISDNIVIDLPTKLKGYHSLFLKNGVDDIISYRLLKDIELKIEGKEATHTQIKSIIIDKLYELIPVEKNYCDVMTNKIVALAGPTGVGKTTTIAKVAATMTLKYGKKVCLITVDNFRIGAVEQLKTYAEIVNLPLYVATSPEELLRIVTKVKGKYDCVLIDSMGRGQFDASQIAGISDFFKLNTPITVVLVFSMASNHIELYDTFDKYEILHPDYLIFTKLDETKYFGPLINIPVKKKLPLLLLTTGQNVPDDMEMPDGKKIAKKVLQEIPTLWGDK